MKRRHGAVVAALVLAWLALSPPQAHAETPPNMWDVAKDPAVRERYQVHLDVERKLAALPDPSDRGAAGLRALLLNSALAQLDAADAENSPDVRLRFDLARVQYQRKVYDGLIPLLRGALLQAPDHPQAVQAYWMLALAYAHSGNTHEELATYDLYLAHESDPIGRATAIMNRAEGYMRLGRLRDAIDGYREADAILAPLPSGVTTLASARWGLAVALDRYGDARGALDAAKSAFQLDPRLRMVTDSEEVFFVPEYDRYWYIALGYQAAAAAESRASKVAQALLMAELQLAQYLIHARANTEPWIRIAELRLASVKKKRIEAEARAAKEPAAIDLE